MRIRCSIADLHWSGGLRDLGPSIQWVHSYVTDDKIYCVYNAPDEALVRKHAQQGASPPM